AGTCFPRSWGDRKTGAKGHVRGIYLEPTGEASVLRPYQRNSLGDDSFGPTHDRGTGHVHPTCAPQEGTLLCSQLAGPQLAIHSRVIGQVWFEDRGTLQAMAFFAGRGHLPFVQVWPWREKTPT